MKNITVIYDNDCGFCRWSIDLFRQWDKKGMLRFVPCRSEERAKDFPQVGEEECMGALQAIFTNGSRKSGFDAVAHVMRYFSGWKKFVGFFLIYTPGLLIAGRIVYRWIAKNRYKIKCDDDQCHT
jgi:predicted DCC family thiol-disulfide oxidoreductase YuxK